MYKPQPYILLIDDDEDDLEMFSSELEMKGIKVKTFDSSTNALFYLTLNDSAMELPSLIILDFNMPKKNGRQVLRGIKDNKNTEDIPVVMYSTGMDEILKTQLLKTGASNCLAKPRKCEELSSQVKLFQEIFLSCTPK